MIIVYPILIVWFVCILNNGFLFRELKDVNFRGVQLLLHRIVCSFNSMA